MKSNRCFGCFLWVALFIGACTQPEPSPEAARDWKASMQGLAQSLSRLLPYLYDDAAFAAGENQKLIYEETSKLASSVHGLEAMSETGDFDPDPLFSYYRTNLAQDLRTAREGLTTGRRDYSQFILKQATQLCIQCHTRGKWGPQFAASIVSPERLVKMPRLPRADLLVAVRSFDEGLNLYRQIVARPDKKERQGLRERLALKKALNVALRVKQDTALALAVIDDGLKSAADSETYTASLRKWKLILSDWPPKRWARANRLLAVEKITKQADQSRGYWGDDSGYASYLLASALLHDELRSNSKFKSDSNSLAQLLFKLGHSYQNLNDEENKSLAMLYFKSCIMKHPHSRIARECYGRIESDSYFESAAGRYTDSVNYLDYLQYLKELAWPKDTKFNTLDD